MKSDPLERLRAICLALPEATEKIAWGEPTFRVGATKMFAMFTNNHHGDSRIALWWKAPSGAQEILVGADPQRFFVPPYVGHKGWIGMRLDGKVDWSAVADIVRDSYLMTAPKKIATRLQAETSAARAPKPIRAKSKRTQRAHE